MALNSLTPICTYSLPSFFEIHSLALGDFKVIARSSLTSSRSFLSIIRRAPVLSAKPTSTSLLSSISAFTYFFCPPLIHLSIASLSKRQTLPILIAGIFPSAAYLQMVISWSFRYFASSFVVIICGISNSPFPYARHLIARYFCIIFIIPKTYKVNKKLLILVKNILSLYS